MGRAILKAALAGGQFAIVGATDRGGSTCLGQDVGTLLERPPLGVHVTDDVAAAFAKAQVVIDFTSPEGTIAHARAAAARRVPLVIGTTGFTEAQLQELRHISALNAVVFSPNMSVGVNLFWHVAKLLAASCGADYQLAIEETHHVHKKDAPSGTAKQLHAVVAQAGQRDPASIPMVSHREGEVIGDHTITFDSAGDRIAITHHAKTRSIFAEGALVAATWAIDKPAGWYGMNDVLGIK